jgi:hypothetical protein
MKSETAEADAATDIPRAIVDWQLVKRLSSGANLDPKESKALYVMVHHLENEVASLREALAAHSAPGHEPDVYETRFTRECLWTEFPKDIALQKAAAGWALRKLYRRGRVDGRAQVDTPKGLPW